MLTHEFLLARLNRLCSVMAEHDVPFLLTADPINICYATGARNMTVYGMMGGYAVDFSRTFVCGGEQPSPVQRSLHELALDQLQHNASLLAPGRTFEEFATRAWEVPKRYRPFGYYCLPHGLGLSGEHPNIPLADPARAYNFAGQFEPGMVMCVESYIGDSEHQQGIKLEDQFVITDDGSRRITTFSLELAR